MLPRKNRLQKFFRGGRIVSSATVKLFFVENGLDFSRFGVSLKSGVFKKAVERNRVKRLVREFLRLNLKQISPGFDFFFVVQARSPEPFGMDFWSQEITELFSKIKIYV